MGKAQTIAVDAETAALIEKKAADAGLTAAQLVAALVHAEIEAESEASIDELEKRWAEVEQGDETVPHEKVIRWLRTWGTADFKTWSDE